MIFNVKVFLYFSLNVFLSTENFSIQTGCQHFNTEKIHNLKKKSRLLAPLGKKWEDQQLWIYISQIPTINQHWVLAALSRQGSVFSPTAVVPTVPYETSDLSDSIHISYLLGTYRQRKAREQGLVIWLNLYLKLGLRCGEMIMVRGKEISRKISQEFI